MATYSFLDKDGLAYYHSKIVEKLNNKSPVSHSHSENLNEIERSIVEDMYGNTIVKTLKAGETELIFYSSSITANSMFDIYADKFGITPLSVSSDIGSVSLTFKPLEENVNVKVIIHDAVYELIGDKTSNTNTLDYIIKEGKTVYSEGAKVTGTMETISGLTITPTGTTETTITKGKYLDGDLVIAGDNKLISNNIKKGTSIFGINGTLDNVITTIKVNGVALSNNDPRIVDGTLDINSTYTSTSAQLASIPYNYYYGDTVTLNDEIHILGSVYTSLSQHHYKYSTSTNTWTSVSTLPFQFLRGRAVVYNGEIHLLGSGATGATGFEHYKLNKTTNEWEEVSTLPYKFASGAAFVLNGLIHIMGGCFEKSKHYKWNGTEWIEGTSTYYPFNYGGYAIFNEELHLIGGWETGTKRNHYAFNPHARTWREVSTLPYDFNTISACIFGNEIHILGDGTSSSGTGKQHYKFNGTTWEQLDDLPFSFKDGSVAICKNKLYTIGSSQNMNANFSVGYVEYTFS